MGRILDVLFPLRRSPYADPKYLRDALDDPSTQVQLVDVRTREEYEEGHIPGARNIPHNEIGLHPPTADKDEAIVLYCRSGARAKTAKRVLRNLGYSFVTNFGALWDWPWDVERGPQRTE
jgi:rhodanese-related sulfurtransferase